MSMRTFVATLGCVTLLSSQPSAAGEAAATRVHTTMRVVATAYCHKGRTKSGILAHRSIVASDPRVLPLGSMLIIPDTLSAGTYTVMDTGSRVKGRAIDIFMPSCASAARFGRKPLQVRIIRRGWNGTASASLRRNR
jgi:3D (Asp-Asp-Asp) domain-containing protein